MPQRVLIVAGHLVVLTELRRVAEPRIIERQQRESRSRDRNHCRRQQLPVKPPRVPPREQDRHHQHRRTGQDRRPRPQRQSVNRARRRQPKDSPTPRVQRRPQRRERQQHKQRCGHDRHLPHVGPTQEHRHAVRQPEHRHRERHHAATDVRKIPASHRHNQTDAHQKTRARKNRHRFVMPKITPGQ